jgi:hypothetical protein
VDVDARPLTLDEGGTSVSDHLGGAANLPFNFDDPRQRGGGFGGIGPLKLGFLKNLLGSVKDDALRQATALNALMAEWTSARSYADRVANLHGTGSGTTFSARLNGNVFLKVDGRGASVSDDGAQDVLTGSAGLDWFFANLGSGVKDEITDLGSPGFADELDFIFAP